MLMELALLSTEEQSGAEVDCRGIESGSSRLRAAAFLDEPALLWHFMELRTQRCICLSR